MNRTSKMGALFREKMPLRKTVDYQEECLLRMIHNTLFFKKRTEKLSWYISQKISFFKDWTFSKGSSLLSLKTGLVQREVASREESSIWTNRLSVKQDFFYKERGIIWTELVRWGLFFSEKCHLERQWIIKKNAFWKWYIIHCYSKKRLLRKTQLIHIGNVFFL